MRKNKYAKNLFLLFFINAAMQRCSIKMQKSYAYNIHMVVCNICANSLFVKHVREHVRWEAFFCKRLPDTPRLASQKGCSIRLNSYYKHLVVCVCVCMFPPQFSISLTGSLHLLLFCGYFSNLQPGERKACVFVNLRLY